MPVSANEPNFPICTGVIDAGPVVGSKDGVVHVTVGGTWTTMRQSTTWMTYGANQSTSLGIGVAPSVGGNFTESGTVTVTSGLKETFKKHTGNLSRLYRTDFVYELYRYCGHTFTEAKDWAGGKIYQNVTALQNLTKCVPEGSGPASSTVSKGSAATFKGGVSIAGDIGINLSAQTGYSATATLFFDDNNPNDPGAKLCGTTDFPGSANPGWVQLEP